MKNLNIQLFAANPNAVIPGTDGRNGRSVDKIWQQSDRLSRAIQGALGLEFGSVLTIQESGVKEENKLYLDSLDGKLYRCKKRTESLANTTELFELFSVKTNSDRLDNLFGVVDINGEPRKLEIRTEHLWSQSSTTTDIVFSKPFTNACLFVTAIDDVTTDANPRAINIDSSFLTRTGCKFVHNGITLYSYHYIAIGY